MGLFINKNNNTSSIKILNKTANNYLEVFLFDINNPYVVIKKYNHNKLESINRLDLEPSQLENAVILNYNKIVGLINSLITNDSNTNEKPKKYFIDLKICSQTIFKSVISLPKINIFKAMALKQKEIKESFDKYNKKYLLIEDMYSYDLGIVYNEYFINNDILKNWQEIAKITNTKISSLQLFSGYLYSNIKNLNYDFIDVVDDIEKKKLSKLSDYSVIYIKEGVAIFLLVNDNQLINAYTLKYENIEEIVKKYILIIGKFECEFSKRKIETLYINSDIETKFSDYFKNINLYQIKFNCFELMDIENNELIDNINQDESLDSNQMISNQDANNECINEEQNTLELSTKEEPNE